jgi:hypothetical protein
LLSAEGKAFLHTTTPTAVPRFRLEKINYLQLNDERRKKAEGPVRVKPTTLNYIGAVTDHCASTPSLHDDDEEMRVLSSKSIYDFRQVLLPR